jgi:hypothetical protein
VAFALEELLYFLSSFVTSRPGGRITASIAWMTGGYLGTTLERYGR